MHKHAKLFLGEKFQIRASDEKGWYSLLFVCNSEEIRLSEMEVTPMGVEEMLRLFSEDPRAKVISHAYSNYGNFTVILTVVDNYNLSDSHIRIIRVREYPIASFTPSPSPAYRNLPVTFNATESAPRGGKIKSYFWDFGDGSTLNSSEPIVQQIGRAHV